MARHFKVDDLLNDHDLAELRRFAAERSATVDKVWSWLRQRGYKVSRGAAHNWMRQQRERTLNPVLSMREDLHRHIDGLTASQLGELYFVVLDKKPLD